MIAASIVLLRRVRWVLCLKMKTFICWCKLGIFLSNDWPSINPHLLKHVLKQEHRPTTPKLRLRVSHIFLSHKVSKLSQIDILVYMEKIIRILLAKHIFFSICQSCCYSSSWCRASILTPQVGEVVLAIVLVKQCTKVLMIWSRTYSLLVDFQVGIIV